MSIFNGVSGNLTSDTLELFSQSNQILIGIDRITTFDVVTTTDRILTIPDTIGDDTFLFESDIPLLKNQVSNAEPTFQS